MKKVLVLSIILNFFIISLTSALTLTNRQHTLINKCISLGAPYNLGKQLAALVLIESSAGEKISNNEDSIGILQIRPCTARYIMEKRLGKEFYISEKKLKKLLRYNEDFAITISLWYLQYLLEKFPNDEELAILAYNVGPTKVKATNGKYDPQKYMKKYRYFIERL